MKNKKSIVITLLIFVLLLGGASILYQRLQDSVERQQLAETEEAEEEAGEDISKAPDFTVYDIHGEEVHLSDYVGKPVIMNFWASWCDPCKSEMPDFEEAYKTYGTQIQFMMINLTDGTQETQEGAADFIAEQGYTFPVFYDQTYDAAGQYVTGGIPITFFIDAEGNFVAYGQGALDAETLQSGIDMLIK